MKKLLICPQCGSRDIHPDFSAHSFGQSGFFNQYRCNKCGYQGSFVIEVDDIDEKDIPKMGAKTGMKVKK